MNLFFFVYQLTIYFEHIRHSHIFAANFNIQTVVYMENAKLRCKMSYYRHYGGSLIPGELLIYFIERCDKLEYYNIEFVEYGKIFYSYNTNYYIEGFPTLYVLSELINYCKDLKIELCVTDL